MGTARIGGKWNRREWRLKTDNGADIGSPDWSPYPDDTDQQLLSEIREDLIASMRGGSNKWYLYEITSAGTMHIRGTYGKSPASIKGYYTTSIQLKKQKKKKQR